MLVTYFVMVIFLMVLNQDLRLVTNTFGLQHQSPTSMSPMKVGQKVGLRCLRRSYQTISGSLLVIIVNNDSVIVSNV